MKLTAIGDPHGHVDQYKEIIDKCEFSICVGDFGFKEHWDAITPHLLDSLPHIHKCNGGNHEYGPYVKTHPFSCGNYGWWVNHSIFTVRGAESIDKHLRTEGIDWFANEELTYQEQLEAFDEYCKVKPKIVISHDCPQTALTTMFKMGWSYGKSQTRTMLEMMFLEHKPDLWVFGHHHQSVKMNILGTEFVCLDELETLTIEL